MRQVAREVRYVVAAIPKWRASGEGSKVLDDDDNRHQSECLAPRTIAKRKKPQTSKPGRLLFVNKRLEVSPHLQDE